MLTSIPPTIKALFTMLAGIGALAGGLGYFISQFRTGGNNLTAFWKEQADEYKTAMAEKDRVNDEKFATMNAKLSHIEGQLAEKEKQIKQYLDILQNRDPATLEFQKLMVSSMERMTEVMSDIHTMTKAEHERDFQFTATVSKTPA